MGFLSLRLLAYGWHLGPLRPVQSLQYCISAQNSISKATTVAMLRLSGVTGCTGISWNLIELYLTDVT